MSLTLSAIPGFSDVPAANFDGGNVASDADLKALLLLAKFGAVRCEQFQGYYKNGETVALPTSAADGYVYARNELIYVPSWYWTGAGGSDCNGSPNPPGRGATSGGGTMLQMGCLVNATTGAVTTNVSYFSGAQHDTNDGILLVTTIGLRLR